MKKKISFLLFCLLSLPLWGRAQTSSPYIHRVFEYRPAPGQFVNLLPEFETGDGPSDMAQKAEECIRGQEKILITLGSYGGYVVFGFDHRIENVANALDFRIWGNAFYADANPNPNSPPEGGSCEPGIILVACDDNGNGLPDDTWYELAGSEYHKTQTKKNYQITYYRPDEAKEKTPHSQLSYLNDTSYIRWKNNDSLEGFLARNTFHEQAYYPLWLNDDSLSFRGTLLPPNGVDESEDGSYYVLYAYPWGYADNHPNSHEKSGLDIAWAVDSLGNTVDLPGIDFVKVYTGVQQYCGWLGETSTEIMGAEDLHLVATSTVEQTPIPPRIEIYPNPAQDLLQIRSETETDLFIYDAAGHQKKQLRLHKGLLQIDLSSWKTGVYLLVTPSQSWKIIKNL